MKIIKLLIFTLLSLAPFASEDIPHYAKYPRTPIVDYKEEILDFYSTKNLYGEFSNFALFPIMVNGVLWPTSEHYYQAHKYEDQELIEWVRLASSPYEAAQRGRDKSIPKRADWTQTKDEFMRIAVYAKFEQYEVLRQLLLSTNQSKIFEHTSLDCYWGDCLDRSGLNKLGHLLMQIRADFNSSHSR